MRISEADLEDLDKLIEIRIDFLRDDGNSMSMDMENTLRAQLAEYIPKHLNRDLFIFTAKEDESIIATVFLSLAEKIPNTVRIPHMAYTGRTADAS